jgi:serine/threonine protein kinase
LVTLVLLSPKDHAWKITDFGLTREGSSSKAISSRSAKGTYGYRAPELVRDHSMFTKESDIFSLGCILYELISGGRAFPHDSAVFNYCFGHFDPPDLPPLTLCEKLNAYTTLLVKSMLEVDWWRRPPASAILKSLDFISAESCIVQFYSKAEEEPNSGHTVALSSDDERWPYIRWQPFW